MRKEFDDYFSNNILSISNEESKPYIVITAESDDDMAQVVLDKDSTMKLIEHLQDIYKSMY